MALLGWPKTIKWSDFGSPRGAVPSSYGGSHADCHIGISIDYSWQGTQRVTPGGDYRLRNVKVVVTIDSSETWVLPGVPTASNHARVLKREQGHFNIAGITARDVDRALAALRDSDETSASDVAEGIISSGQAEEDTYDDDPANGGTDHGNDVTQQATRNSKIAAANSLSSLP
jgi:hypothetical protein